MPADEHMADEFTIGVDFGTLSGRAVVVRVRDGAEMAQAVMDYPHAVVDRTLPATGERLPSHWALQVPSDYLAVLGATVPQAVRESGVDVERIVGIGVDFTSATLLPVDSDGTPLAEQARWASDKHAYVKLWKHHAAQAQADRITALAIERREPWLPRYGGLVSSEWEFAKALQILEEAPELYAEMYAFVEASDWIVWQLCGRYVRNVTSLGYKGLYQDGAYPSAEFLGALHPGFAHYPPARDVPVGALGSSAGSLTADAAAWLGLPEGIAVAVGNVDAHVAAPAAQAVHPGQLMLIMGTSTCHIVNSERLEFVPGMCGAVDGGVLSGLWGYEAGQSAVGDIFAWFVDNCVPPAYHDEVTRRGESLHEYLTGLAAEQQVGQHGLVVLDWFNGNRSVLVNHDLSGLILGLTLGTRPEDIYRALLECTAFGTKVIVDAFESSGVAVDEVIITGGLKRNAVLMQIYADVLGKPLSVARSSQGPAVGSAIHAAVAAGRHADVTAAAEAMGGRDRAVYRPRAAESEQYRALFAEYQALHDHFGRGGNDVMKRLARIRRDAHR